MVEFCGLAALSLLLVCFLETILDDLQPFCSVTLICYISIQQTHYEKKYSYARGPPHRNFTSRSEGHRVSYMLEEGKALIQLGGTQ